MENKTIKGYKVFNPDWTCRGFQYEVGKTYTHEGNIEMCGAGFHFCRKLSDCFNYYRFDPRNKVAEIEAIGNIETRCDKSVTDKITILKELSWHDVLDLCNTGDWNTGNCNTGDCNTGDCNTGNWNTGDWNTGDWNTGNWNTGNWNTGNWNTGNWNTGDWNTGDYNTGDCNTGDCNTGDYNTGDCNTGDCNTGDCNTGDWNSTNRSTGFFNSVEQKLICFNKEFNGDAYKIVENLAVRAMSWKFENSWWIYTQNMTEKEKEEHPDYETTGGYLKSVDFKAACAIMWDNMTEDEKEAVWTIPNFDPEVFKEITGIEVTKNED